MKNILQTMSKTSNKEKISTIQKITLIVLGVFLSAVLLEVGLRLSGFVLLSMQEHRNAVSIRQKGSYRILCLGESTTQFGGNHSYPRQLEQILNQRNLGVQFSVINKGDVGADTTVILSKLEGYLNRYKPDMVIAMMGVNDKYEEDREDTKLYEKTSFNQIQSFLKSFRIFKLVKFLRLHIISKFNESKDMKSKENDKYISINSDHGPRAIILKEQEKILNEPSGIDISNLISSFKLAWAYWNQGAYEEVDPTLFKVEEIVQSYSFEGQEKLLNRKSY